MRIIHLSDFHFDESNVKDAEEFVLKALLKDLIKQNSEKKIDFIFFTGDMIDKGGLGFNNDIELALITFEEKIINPIIKAIQLPKERVFFSPGNHEINRKTDSEIEEIGLEHKLSSTEDVNHYIDSEDTMGRKRILPFKSFERYYYSEYAEDYTITDYQSSFKLTVDNYTVGITCFNTAWRCYDSNKDKGKILLGERQVTNARKSIENCNLKIALFHHPLDWMKDFDYQCVDTFIRKDYHMLFCGHVHSGSSWVRTDMYNNTFVSIAPANWTFNIRTTDINHMNGYFVVDFDFETNTINTNARKYYYLKEQYDINPELGQEGGKTMYKLPNPIELSKQNHEVDITKKIKELHYEEPNQHLLSFSTDTTAPKDIDSIFVLPHLVNKAKYEVDKKANEAVFDLESICKSEDNILLFGAKESGKTVLLDKILIEFLNNTKIYRKIPVFIDFEDIGNKRFETLISHYLGIGITRINELIKEHKVILLVDNINLNKLHQITIKRMQQFIQDNPNISFITTYCQSLEGEIPLEIFEFPILASSKIISISSFKTKQIKELISKWFSNNKSFDTPEKLDTLVKMFLTLNIPRTPLAASMFLWIIEQQENYKPVNHAAMLENFIQRIFKKLSKVEIYSEDFDYWNKERLLTEIAYLMYENDFENYRISYQELSNFVAEYLRVKKFEFEAEKVLQHFLSKGILAKEKDDNISYIRFRFNCFFQYFLMKKMEFDNTFKEFVLDEENFLQFTDEIDYYTGLKRDQIDILKTVIERMEAGFKEITDQINNLPHGFDSFFINQKSIVEMLDDGAIKKLQEIEKPSEEELDEIKDQTLEASLPEKGIEKKQNTMNRLKKLELLWTLAAKILKNTEETDLENFKGDCYQRIIVCSMAFANLYKYLLEDFLKKNKDHNVNFDEAMLVSRKFLPLIHEIVMYTFIGSGKLKVVVREKIQEIIANDSVSDFEKFISVFLYADMRGTDYIDYIKTFLRNIKHGYIRDMILFKLVSYYHLRSKTKDQDKLYLNMISDLIVKARKIDKEKKASIIEDYKNNKKKNIDHYQNQVI